jgi:hypothetical protein
MVNYIKFVGDYSSLKNKGYTFQKLFAGNYMQWEKNGFRVWKKGAELTIDRLTNYEGSFLKMLIDSRYKEAKLVANNKFLHVVKNNETFEIESSEEALKAEIDSRKALMTWYSAADELMPEPNEIKHNMCFGDREKWLEDRSDALSDQIGHMPKHDTYRDSIPLKTMLALVKMFDANEIQLGVYEKNSG